MQEIPKNHKMLVYGDVSGSTSYDDIKEMLAFTGELSGAHFSTFDTEMRMLPQYPGISLEVVNAFGHGGTDIRRSIRMLGYHMLETYYDYRCIYILGDLQMEPFRCDDIINIKSNFYVLAMGETQEAEVAQAEKYGKELIARGLGNRTKALSFKEYRTEHLAAKERAKALGYNY